MTTTTETSSDIALYGDKEKKHDDKVPGESSSSNSMVTTCTDAMSTSTVKVKKYSICSNNNEAPAAVAAED